MWRQMYAWIPSALYVCSTIHSFSDLLKMEERGGGGGGGGGGFSRRGGAGSYVRSTIHSFSDLQGRGGGWQLWHGQGHGYGHCMCMDIA
ncbi:unnamed protein product [Closterium sp. NIES-54]